MGQQEAGPRPEDLYRAPLMPGLYPPLGFAPDGTPLFRPDQRQPSTTQTSRAEWPQSTNDPAGMPYPGDGTAPPVPPDAPFDDAAPDEQRRQPQSPGRFGVGLVFALVAAVVVGLVFYGFSLIRQSSAQSQDAPTTLTIVDPTTPDIPNGQQQPGNPMPPPGATGAPRDSDTTGRAVTYDATIEGSGTILYVDDVGLRSEFTPPPTWHLEFTAGSAPLRLLVLAGVNSSASCEIRVDGQTVSTDRVGPESTRRTATCRA
ncbi:hypothetical protein LK459_07295 [Gordonia otitidis]|uniref:hypothetical protein n=1 Tax=Gordonia otitidis TaxID=249058 RepID=UPI001D157C95|nr:hypothetical protein [Gordonia otitidis]UEA60633.1 hypothetical protein LK459_07295 [Gordonia otitidis]